MDMVVRLKPSHIPAAYLRACAVERLGNHQQALNELDHLVKITEKFPYNCALAHNGRALILATCPNASFRNANQAIADAKRACELSDWRLPNCIGTLAAAYAEAGDWDSAIRFQQQAISHVDKEARAIASPEKVHSISAKMRAEYQQHLAAYQRHQAWRSNPNEGIWFEMR
jgi:tetratricopeptide (TPR) repeat protein